MSPKHAMRRRLLCHAIAVLSAAVLSSCGGDGALDGNDRAGMLCKPEQNFTLVFYDRSTSSRTGERILPMFADTLRQLASSSLVCNGDQIRAFLVHGQTRGKAYRRYLVNQISAPDLDTLATPVQRIKTAQHRDSTATFQRDASQELIAFFDSTHIRSDLAANTDLLGALEVASEEFAAAPRRAHWRIYFFSDMNESMPLEARRDFDQNPPRSRAEAESWAMVDARDVLANMDVQPDRLRNVDVRILLGPLSNRVHSENVKLYWLKLFELAGIQRDRIFYN